MNRWRPGLGVAIHKHESECFRASVGVTAGALGCALDQVYTSLAVDCPRGGRFTCKLLTFRGFQDYKKANCDGLACPMRVYAGLWELNDLPLQ
jgi:hypothetical protein